MSDTAKEDKKEDKKDDKKDKAKPAETAAAAGGGGIKALAGPILAGVVLVGVGVGLGMWLPGLIIAKPAPTDAAAAGGDAHGSPAAAHGKDPKGGHGETLLHSTGELMLDDLKSNVTGQGGRKYVVMKCSMRIASDALKKFMGGGGGGHGGGGGGDEGGEVKRILQASIEEHLKTYQLEEFSSNTIYKQLEKGFTEIVERHLRELFPDLAKDKRIVHKVTINGLLVQ